MTENVHHQQQNLPGPHLPGIMTPELYYPVLDCFVRGLPHAYRQISASPGTSIRLEISGECGGQWVLSKGAAGWGFLRQSPEALASAVTIPQAIAWRVFTKGIDRDAVY